MEKEQQLTNKELDEVNGGYTVFKHTDGKYYEFIGDDSQRNQKYLCFHNAIFISVVIK